MEIIIKEKKIEIRNLTVKDLFEVKEEIKDSKIAKLNDLKNKKYINEAQYFEMLSSELDKNIEITSLITNIDVIPILLKRIIKCENKEAFFNELELKDFLNILTLVLPRNLKKQDDEEQTNQENIEDTDEKK